MPRLLDLYCGAGGAGMGYHKAGFDVVGVDIESQPDYPFDFIQLDAIWYAERFAYMYDAIHASPPCQAYSTLTTGSNKKKKIYPELIEPTRKALGETGLPYVIENVISAPVRKDIVLCGEMFGLGVIRHRAFELQGWKAEKPTHVKHRGRVRGWRHGTYYDGPYLAVYGEGGGKGEVKEWQSAMGIDWTENRKSIAEAIPPAYTEYLGKQLIGQVT